MATGSVEGAAMQQSRRSGGALGGFVAIAAAALWPAVSPAQTPVTVVEYYVKALDSYFITGRDNEKSLLDGLAGFSRTGMSFAGVAAAGAPASLSPICRYYVSLAVPYTSTHFYGVKDTDCVQIAALNPVGFAYEGLDFATTLPDANRACPPSAPTAIRRAFRPGRNGKTSNHRYATSQAIINGMVAQGWTDEGVTFCAGSSTVVTKSGNQTALETYLLNGGVYNLRFGNYTSGPNNGSGYVVAFHTIATQAPGATPTPFDSPLVNLTRTRPLPDTSTWARERVFLPDRGDVFVTSNVPSRFTFAYVGDAIRMTQLSEDGATPLYSNIISEGETIALTGTLATTPADVTAVHPQLAVNGIGGASYATSWLPGAGYYKRKSTREHDTYVVGDCNGQTFTEDITPCVNTTGKTLEAFFPIQDGGQGKTWQIGDGSIVSVANGPRIWVAATPQPFATNPTVGYRAYYQGVDGIFIGRVIRAGTVIETANGSAPVSHQIRFNKAAIDSITAALPF